ncbi:MAG: class II fructose-bisphosphate aldolase [Anaerolineae bacterium]|nr:class II fructose-bisphosphate aldolase [Anaerolineae bacterium]
MNKPLNVWTLKKALSTAEQVGCALGSFSPRYTPMIAAVLRAGEKLQSPLIVQISQRELERYHITPSAFAEEFYRQMHEQRISVPVVLHLDHTKKLEVIREAIAAGFTSVMIDASELPLVENIKTSKAVVDYAHEHGVSVEAELGMIGTTDYVETEKDEELYTDPDEAQRFVNETQTDALAVSVGTAHGVYTVRQPKIDYERLKAIRMRTPVHLVLHGGSGVPSEMMLKAIRLPNGGVSKVNVATDLELALLESLGRSERMTDAECKALSADKLELGRAAVQSVVQDKMINFLDSSNRAAEFFSVVNKDAASK